MRNLVTMIQTPGRRSNSSAFVFFALLTSSFCAPMAMAAPTDDFVTTWKTDNPGGSNSTSITVPMVGGPYDVDWNNDGVFDEFGLTDLVTHDFGIAGTYTIRIRGTYEYMRFDISEDNEKIVSLDQWGTHQWTTMWYAFYGAVNLQIPATDIPDFSAVTQMNRMFFQASKANPDTSDWDTSAVISMSSMFRLAASANPDTSGWDTSLVRGMDYMFAGATAANPDTSGWDTSAVKSMRAMFGDAIAANPDTSGWITFAVTDMAAMFEGATVANPNTSGWDTSKVTGMWEMFSNAPAANPDTSGWDTSAVTSMHQMFSNATVANPDTSGWDTSAVTSMREMFAGATLANPDTSGWDTSKVTNMERMFFYARSFNRDIGSWDVTSLTDATNMFEGHRLWEANYESLLIGWDAQVLQPGVTFSGGDSTYCSDQAVAARAHMVAADSWNISDGGEICAGEIETLFVPIDPCRIIDTRQAGGSFGDGTRRYYEVIGDNLSIQGGTDDCGIPTTATAVHLNFTSVNPFGFGYLRAWPYNEPEPLATLMAFTAGPGISNATALTICNDCPYDFAVKIYLAATDLVVEVLGYYVPAGVEPGGP